MSKFSPPDPPQGSFTTNIKVTNRVPTEENRLSIREADWNRLKNNLQKCKNPFPNVTRKVDFMAALCVTTIFFTLSLIVSKTSVDSWVYALFVAVIFFTALFAWEFNQVAKHDIDIKKSEIADIESDMQEIESNLIQVQ